jgi:hypothetical protein
MYLSFYLFYGYVIIMLNVSYTTMIRHYSRRPQPTVATDKRPGTIIPLLLWSHSTNGWGWSVTAMQHSSNRSVDISTPVATKVFLINKYHCVSPPQTGSKYYSHLVANTEIARAFMSLPLLYKISWVTSFVNDKCSYIYVCLIMKLRMLVWNYLCFIMELRIIYVIHYYDKAL